MQKIVKENLIVAANKSKIRHEIDSLVKTMGRKIVYQTLEEIRQEMIEEWFSE